MSSINSRINTIIISDRMQWDAEMGSLRTADVFPETYVYRSQAKKWAAQGVLAGARTTAMTMRSRFQTSKITTLHVNHAFLYVTSLPSPCTIATWKCLISRFKKDAKKRRRIFLSILKWGPQGINPREICVHLTFSAKWKFAFFPVFVAMIPTHPLTSHVGEPSWSWFQGTISTVQKEK